MGLIFGTDDISGIYLGENPIEQYGIGTDALQSFGPIITSNLKTINSMSWASGRFDLILHAKDPTTTSYVFSVAGEEPVYKERYDAICYSNASVVYFNPDMSYNKGFNNKPLNSISSRFKFTYVKNLAGCFRQTNIYRIPSGIDSGSVENMYETFINCERTLGSPLCGPNVTNMVGTYKNCYNITGSPVCGPSVTNMYQAYYRCNNISGIAACGDSVENMSNAYYQTSVEYAACGPKVTDIHAAYIYCDKLKNTACGDNVIDMGSAYYSCGNITGSPVCGPNVVNMAETYTNCYNMTGSPVCGPNVVNMSKAYQYCRNLTGAPVCGPLTNNLFQAYCACNNISGDFYLYNESANIKNCFVGRNYSSGALRINIHVSPTSNYYANPTALIREMAYLTGVSSYEMKEVDGHYETINTKVNFAVYGDL